MARALGIELTVLDFGMEATVDLGALEQALADRTIRAVLLVHVDTASSVRNDVAAVRAVMDRLGHPALLMIDCIASFGCDAVAMDAWGADLMVTACQKGLMTPPGVALVAFNDRAAQARARLTRVSAYWDWQPRVTSTDLSGFWDGTAPTHHLFGLRAALDLIAAETPAAVLARHARLARAVWAACQGWASAGPLRLNIADPALRSHAVTSVHLPGADRLQDWCEAHLGLTLGVGLGREPRGDWFRIGHMGHVNGQMILSVLGGIETGLTALGIPHGPGVTAAAKVLAA
jgi:alanine-glyoxylate transaminase/serine-glyoxylate transaminase/serine-pyruvate transaminase